MEQLAQPVGAEQRQDQMLANAKYIYALDMWTVEKRPNGWYFSKSAYHGDKHRWRGPYASEFRVTLMIARELRKEIKKRQRRCRTGHARARRFRQQPSPQEDGALPHRSCDA
jgi:hypothetical protein